MKKLMKIFKTIPSPQAGQYILSEDGFLESYSSPASYIVHGKFKFCGCGVPPIEIIKLIYAFLSEINRENVAFSEKEANLKTYIQENPELILWFIFYWLDTVDLLEHGSALPGWVMDEDFLDDLKLILLTENKG